LSGNFDFALEITVLTIATEGTERTTAVYNLIELLFYRKKAYIELDTLILGKGT